MIVAIDGPSGAGKSSVARALGERLAFSCLDTGAMYRCVAVAARRAGCVDDDAAIGELAGRVHIDFEFDPETRRIERVLLDGEDVTREIRTPQVDVLVSRVASIPAVREHLVEEQRRIGSTGDFVVEGRDIGTVVFPDAACKVFLTASAAARAERRHAQNLARGMQDETVDEIRRSIEERDARDRAREVAPLVAAADAHEIDSTALSFEQVLEEIVALVDAARG